MDPAFPSADAILTASESAAAGDPAQAVEIFDRLASALPRNHWLHLRAATAAAEASRPLDAWRRLRAIIHSDTIGPAAISAVEEGFAAALEQTTGPIHVERPAEYLRRWPGRTLLPHLPELRINRPKAGPFPFEMPLPDLVGNANDFRFLIDAARQNGSLSQRPDLTLRIVVLAGNEAETQTLYDTLAAQSWPADRSALTVFGETPIDPDPALGTGGRLLRHPSARPWTLPADLQLDLMTEGADLVVFVSAPARFDPTYLERLAQLFNTTSAIQAVPVARPEGGTVFSETILHDDWIRDRYPFRKLEGLDFAVPATRLRAMRGFEPRFALGRFAARDLSFRLWNDGAYIVPVAVAQHLPPRPSPPVDEQTDKALMVQRSPCPWDRGSDGQYEVPKVSIYIPAYRAGRYIVDAVRSALDQDVEDLEICIADDGSPDATAEILQREFGSEPRVRWQTGRNGGIGHASNRAVTMARGMYVGQLDADDRLKPGAVRRLMAELDRTASIGCAYSSCERIDAMGEYVKDEYSFPEFSREKMLLTSIAHHFRMFRRQTWARTEGFREDIVNAIDYDIFLKMSEISKFQHVDEVLYQRRWHGENTSSVNESHQTRNTFVVQTLALERMGLERFWEVQPIDPKEPRRITYRRTSPARRLFFWPHYRDNPYPRLLYRDLVQETQVIAADIDVVLQAAREASDPENITFHLHWLNKIFVAATSAGEAAASAGRFVDGLIELKERGVHLIWTVHNTLSHDTPWPEEERMLARRIVALVDVLHVHSKASIPEIAEDFPLPDEKIVVAPHGNFLGAYPDFIDRDAARAELGLDPGGEVLLLLGQLRPYKGIDHLLDAFGRLRETRGDATLVLAGQSKMDVAGLIAERCGPATAQHVRLFDRYIDDTELQLFFRAADVAVFPYRRILTSGSMILSLGFGTPVVVPDLGMTREVLGSSEAGRLYDATGDANILADAISEILDVQRTTGHTHLAEAAWTLAAGLKWKSPIQ